MAEGRDVNAQGFFRPPQGRLCADRLKFAAATAAADMGSEVMAEYAARIGETVRVLRCRGIEQDADGFLRLRAKDHHAGRNLAGLASVAVDVENAASAVAPGIHQNFISHSVRNER